MIRILIIKPGFGGGKDGKRFQLLDADPSVLVSMPDIAEPTRGTEGMKAGLQQLQAEMETFHPDILMAGSRGGIYASELLKLSNEHANGLTVPPIFCIGALQTKALCEARNGTHPILLCHGLTDDRNTIDRVRVDCKTSKVAELVEFDDGHALSTLEESSNGVAFLALIHRLHGRYRRGVPQESNEEYLKWVQEDRPKWIEADLQPKIREFEAHAQREREVLYKKRQNTGGGISMLNELKGGFRR